MTTTILDVVVGMAYVYLFFSILCSTVNEWWARARKLRAKFLMETMPILLGSGDSGWLATLLHEHPLIQGIQMSPPYPTYIPAKHFALALTNLAVESKNDASGAVVLSVRERIDDKQLNEEEKCLINTLISSDASLRSVQTRVEQWFDDSMERLSGLYKRHTYVSLLLISLVVSFLFGIDSIRLAEQLYTNGPLRQGVVSYAQEAAKGTLQIPLHVPLGWHGGPSFVPGCMLSALALTLGAPFWFDLLGRLVNLRQTGVPPNLKGKIVAQ